MEKMGDPPQKNILRLEKREQEENKTEISQNKEGIDFVFEQYPELAEIGTKEQYSEYLDTLFPESKVKNIVYHGSRKAFNNFSKDFLGGATKAPSAREGFFFCDNIDNAKEYLDTTYRTESEREDFNTYNEKWTKKLHSLWDEQNLLQGKVRSLKNEYDYEDTKQKRKLQIILELKKLEEPLKSIEQQIDEVHAVINDFNAVASPQIYAVILNMKNPLVFSDGKNSFREESYYDRIQRAKISGNDSLIIEDTADPLPTNIYITLDNAQSYILGTKLDIQRFKEFVETI